MYDFLYRNIKSNKTIYNFCLPLYLTVRYYMIKYFYFYTLKRDFKNNLGYDLDLENPRTFNEKLQWLKVNYRDPIMPACADKVEVRKIVSNEIGEEYLIPIYGVWDNVEDIKLELLPNEFVLKPNHTSGRVLICRDKMREDWRENSKLLKKWLKENYYYKSGEWVYKDIKPKIICEKLLDNNIVDYKFFCFNGKVKIVFIAKDRTQDVRFNFYDSNFNLLPIKWNHENFKDKINKPINFNKMVCLSEKLSKRFPHVRVDWYEVDNKLYFGELTFFHDGGMKKIEPTEWDSKLGSMIDLSQLKKEFLIK